MGKLKPPWIGNKEQRLLLSPESLEQGPAYRSTQQIFIVKWTDLLPWFEKKKKDYDFSSFKSRFKFF
jgi:hypothetical protein